MPNLLRYASVLAFAASCTGSMPGPAPAPLDAPASPPDGQVVASSAPDALAAVGVDGGEMAPVDAAPPPAVGDDGDEKPERALAVDKGSPQLFTIKFKPSDADPATSSNDAMQTAYLDTRVATIRAKLVVTLSGTNNPPGPQGLASWAAGQGFHVYTVAYYNNYNPSQSDPDYFGKARFDEFDGMGRQTKFKVAPVDSVQSRVTRALTFLQTKNPQGDWAYYLNKDGQVRWSDVIFFGQSHGATSAAAFGKLKRLSRAVSMSGPRDTNPVVASWLSLPSPTPIDRFYGFTGTADGQHPDHLKAMEVMGYVGQVVDITKSAPPYEGSHRLQYQGGHTADLSCTPFPEACQYLMGTLPAP